MYGWILCALKSIHATSPSLAGQTVVKTGSSPDFASSLVRSSLLSLYRHLFLIMQFLLCRIDFANKKPLYTNAKRLYKISFPSLVGQTVILNRQFS